MAISKINPPTVASSINANSLNCAVPHTKYNAVQNYDAAIYTITTSPNTSQATVSFYNSTSILLDTITSSGTVSVNLASPATGVYISVDPTANTLVTITKTASALSGTDLSGTLDTITTTSTYNQTGKLYVMAIGGGGGGRGFNNWNSTKGTGGVGSSPVAKMVQTNGATSVTIGAAGSGGGVQNGSEFTPPPAGGTTSFGAFVTSNGGSGYGSSEAPGNAITNPGPSVKSGTNGGGGGGSDNSAQSGGGSGIGTGGLGGVNNGTRSGGAATGYGAGGGGGANGGSANGGAGSPGVVYVLRGF